MIRHPGIRNLECRQNLPDQNRILGVCSVTLPTKQAVVSSTPGAVVTMPSTPQTSGIKELSHGYVRSSSRSLSGAHPDDPLLHPEIEDDAVEVARAAAAESARLWELHREALAATARAEASRRPDGVLGMSQGEPLQTVPLTVVGSVSSDCAA